MRKNSVKRNRLKRAVALAAVLAFALLVSCADDAGGGYAPTVAPELNGEQAPGEPGAADEPEAARVLPNLPEADFGGFSFRIITTDHIANAIMPQEIWAEAETGAPINDAIFRRNRYVEEKFNVEIYEILHDRDSLNAPVIRAVLAGDDAYDLIASNIRELGIMGQRAVLHDLHTVNHIDLSKPWYDQNAASDFSIANRLFWAVGDLQISSKDGTWSVLFNKKLHENLGLDDPYQLVRDGRWTMDRMFEMAAAANRDLDGDGIMTEADQWGMLGEEFNIFALMNGAGMRLVQKDENDLPFYAGFTERDISVFEKAIDYLGDRNQSILPSHFAGRFADIWMDFINPMFATDRVLFFFTSLSRVTWHRDMETDFGILPVPKYDEQQENYVNTVSVWLAGGQGIPITLDGADLDRTAIIMEALNAASRYTLIPAYYDIQLSTQLVRDEESSEMLDIIFANRVFSIEQLYDWGGIVSTITDLLARNDRSFVSAMERIEPRIEREIERTIDAFMEN